MLRCDAFGSVRSRRFAGLSESWPIRLLIPLPIGFCGSDATRGRPLRTDLDDQGRPLLDAGRRHSGCGPVDSRSLMEKDRRGAVLSSKNAACVGKGEEAVLGAVCCVAAAMFSSVSLTPSSSSTPAGCTRSFAETRVGVYLRSGYTRLIGFGMLVELRLFDGVRSAATRGTKYDRHSESRAP